jgi:two-component system nitrate/nitrite response regulator NarL
MGDQQWPIRVVVADQQPIHRHRLRLALESAPGINVVAEASDAPSVLKLIREQEPDVLFLDLALPGCRELKSDNFVSVRTVILLATVDKPKILESFRLGAQGVVLKRSDRSVFVEGVQSVMAGQYWLDSESLRVMVDVLRELLVHSNGETSITDYRLTRRELDIIAKIANGRSNKEVGEEFSISERTVKHHLTNIFSKVGVSSRLQLALFAVNHDLKNNHEPSSLQALRTEAEV